MATFIAPKGNQMPNRVGSRASPLAPHIKPATKPTAQQPTAKPRSSAWGAAAPAGGWQPTSREMAAAKRAATQPLPETRLNKQLSAAGLDELSPEELARLPAPE